MSEATLGSIAGDLADIKTKLADLQAYYSSQPQQTRLELQDLQQRVQILTQERHMLQQLQREGLSKKEAIIYYGRMIKGEKPWLDANAKEKI